MAKMIRFEMLVTEEQRDFLTRQSLRESVRLEQNFSRADWLRKKIDQAMAREAKKK